MKRKFVLIVSGLAAATVGATLAMEGSGHASSTSADVLKQLSVASPALARSQTALDKVPSFLADGPQALPGFNPSSSRLLGADDQWVKYWLGVGNAAETCLVGLLPGNGEYAAMTCASQDELATGGLVLQINDDAVSGRAVYVPAGTDVAPLGMKRVSPQFAVGRADRPSPSIELRHSSPASPAGATDGLTQDTPVSIPRLDAQPAGFRPAQ